MYSEGNLGLLTDEYIRVGIIGSRNSSTESRINAMNLATSRYRFGEVVVSGLAYGIDTFAHTGAIKRTIAVVNNMENPYPKENHRLIQDILDNDGLIISPFKNEVNGGGVGISFLARDNMLVDICDRLYYYGNTNGTKYTVSAAIKKGIPVERRI